MRNRAIEDLIDQDSQLQMTPMIDVTFLLLVFFLCTTQFRMHQRKLPQPLDRECSCSTSVAPDLRLPIEVWVDAQPDGSSPRIRLGRLPIVDQQELLQRVSALIAQRRPSPSATGDDHTVTPRVTLYSTDVVGWGDVVATLDTCLTAGAAGVDFGVQRSNR
jgi:biopolymer transport protein ExbD